MKPLPAPPWPAALLAAALLPPLLPSAQAQGVCSSDGQRAPVALVERFISADCATCWSDAATPALPRGAVALDWIVPGTQGEDAPLSAAATRDAVARLQARGLDAPATASMATSQVTRRAAGAGALRVAQGPALNGYLGASIALRPAARLRQPVTAWLALVETIPAGEEGSPVERNLVRNVLNPGWIGPDLLSKTKQRGWLESRVMGIPPGANPARLRVIGWVEDTQGRIGPIAQSQCAPGG